MTEREVWRGEFKGIGVGPRLKVFAELLSDIKGKLLKAAALYVVMTECGDDVVDVPDGLRRWLPHLDAGDLHIDIFLNADPTVLKRYLSVRADVQQRISKDGTVSFYDVVDGEVKKAALKLSEVDNERFEQIFGEAGEIGNEREQLKRRKSALCVARAVKGAKFAWKVRADTLVVTVKGHVCEIAIAEILKAQAENRK